jgi:hypothetical protein
LTKFDKNLNFQKMTSQVHHHHHIQHHGGTTTANTPPGPPMMMMMMMHSSHSSINSNNAPTQPPPSAAAAAVLINTSMSNSKNNSRPASTTVSPQISRPGSRKPSVSSFQPNLQPLQPEVFHQITDPQTGKLFYANLSSGECSWEPPTTAIM